MSLALPLRSHQRQPHPRAPLRSQDYEQNPQSSRDDMMCHCFYYLQGLNGEVGDLAILPGSHKIVMERGAM